MKKCKRCNVNILDETHTCPLCIGLLEVDEVEDKVDSMYPVIYFDINKFNTIKKIFVFILILVAAGLGFINYITYTGVVWSIIAVVGIIYFGITVTYSIMNNANLASKILVQTIGAGILLVVIDNVIGYRGWSVNYAIPGIIMFANLAIVLLMIVNPMNWQSYFMYQIAITIFSFIPLILFWVGLISQPLLASLTSGISIIILVGTIVFGDRSVKNELIRRFYT
ncbi:MAG: DUF6320 domain-containing protein [Clostridium sp.]|uniref:DUF6320 domain-containing protein n=1 Tax=Clostridium sp. TaxID=1506 RepID=UPI0030590F5F